MCFVVLHAVRVLSAACIHVKSCAAWHAACVFHWLRAFMLSCLVSCVFVFHMAGDLFAGHGFCLSFLCAMCSHVNLISIS